MSNKEKLLHPDTASGMCDKPTTSKVDNAAADNLDHLNYSAVFSVPELLEAILLELPCKDVLLAQRVSRFWKSTIGGSIKLQKALCFIPALRASSPIHFGISSFSHSTSANAFLLDCSSTKQLLLNPVLECFFPRLQTFAEVFQYTKKAHYDLADDRSSTLQKVFATQPPLTKVMCAGTHSSTIFYVENAEGITVADVIRKFKKRAGLRENKERVYMMYGKEAEKVWS